MNRGFSWHPRISGHPRAHPRDFQGCTATLPQEVWCLCLLLRPPLAFLLQPGHPTHRLLPPKASVNKPPHLGRQHHAGWTLLTLRLSQFQGCRWSAHRLPATRPLPPAVLPVCEPISHRTRSRAQAPLVLFTSGRPYHKQVKYHIPTAKATHPAEEPLAFAGLCESYHMKPAEVEVFAFFCEALTLEDGPGLSALLVLDPATGKFLEHRQLCRDPRYKATWDTSYANELGRLCQGIGSGSTPSAQPVSGTNTFFSLTITTYCCTRGKKCAIPWWYVRSVRIRMIRIAPASSLVAIAFASRATLAPTRPHLNWSSCFSTVSYLRKVHGLALLT